MDSRIKELFERYQSGKATGEERKLVEDWFVSFNSEQKDISEHQHGEIFAQMDRKIGDLAQNQPGIRKLYTRWLPVAAAVLIAAVAVVYRNYRRPVQMPVSYSLLSAPNGVRKQFSLPDGSIVFLNSGSSLRVLPDFGIKDRLVSLSGEAFFVVRHDPNKPFSIQSGKLVITDIGTSFDVKAYSNDNQIKVAVETGEVSVKESNPGNAAPVFPKSITRNQQLTYNKGNRHVALNNTQTSEIIAWKENKLRFDNASFSEIATTLERWYGVTVTLHGQADGRHYTVSFNNEPVSNVLKVLGSLSGMNYQITNSSIQINLKPNKSMK